MSSSQVPVELRELFDAATQARSRSYSPYSGVKVGAALRTSQGQVFSGCNVENSSYGATVCAERTAVQKAVSELGSLEITEILVLTDASPAWPPCGMCRQVIAEFARKNGRSESIPIHLANLQGEVRTLTFAELFPDAFTPSHLNR